uniref:sperm motility kinase 2B-like isoform X2 n=1 Tax=Ictidomys tridecemlineatus TaxID=43179 RepID=UPI001A9D7C57|nr:sperm motility kinase 2B-like isoform X2 [Ictidomys tridecemlineatus]
MGHLVIETHQYVYLVMEHGGRGSLFDFIPPGGMQEEEEARRLFRQITCAVCYCHKMHILHGDLKPQNVVLDARGNIRIIDFGLSTVLKPEQGRNRYWHPLEGPAVDTWQLGIILYFILTGNCPSDNYQPELEFPQHVSPEAKRFIRKILSENSRARLSAEEILADPWLNQDSIVSQDATTGRPQGHSKVWKRVRRRMAACLRRLCCCTPSCDGENEAPTPGEQKPARFTNRVVPT